ncbi:MAG: hypothetical protein L0H55_04445 [Candidatus Nitrosocosmicus sp.]|nr:hypothetical protein [Candidatus Nitrosocosmicus sp.]
MNQVETKWIRTIMHRMMMVGEYTKGLPLLRRLTELHDQSINQPNKIQNAN